MSDSFWRNLIGTIQQVTGFQRVTLTGAVIDGGSVANLPNLITYDNVAVVSPITPVTALGMWVRITLTSNVAYTLNAPNANPVAGSLLYLTIRNTIGGAAGAMTFAAAYKAAAWAQPATGNSRSAIYLFDGTNYVEVVRSAADVPN